MFVLPWRCHTSRWREQRQADSRWWRRTRWVWPCAWPSSGTQHRGDHPRRTHSPLRTADTRTLLARYTGCPPPADNVTRLKHVSLEGFVVKECIESSWGDSNIKIKLKTHVLETCAASIIRVDPDDTGISSKKLLFSATCHHVVWNISASKQRATSIFRTEEQYVPVIRRQASTGKHGIIYPYCSQSAPWEPEVSQLWIEKLITEFRTDNGSTLSLKSIKLNICAGTPRYVLISKMGDRNRSQNLL